MTYNPSEILSSIESVDEVIHTIWKTIPNSKEVGWTQSDFNRLHNIEVDLAVLLERCREEVARKGE